MDTLKKYAALRSKIEALQNEELELKAEILEYLQKQKLEKVESDYGKFTVASRRNYKYSDRVAELEEKVKMAKDKEVQKGIAKESITNYLVFKSN